MVLRCHAARRHSVCNIISTDACGSESKALEAQSF